MRARVWMGWKWSLTFLVLCMAIMVLFLASPARADTFTVNSVVDPGDGTCDATECTLREAIDAANANTVEDTITFSVTGTINLAGNQLTVANTTANPDLTIDGPGPDQLSVSGNNLTRVLLINSGAGATINGIKITGGSYASSVGGGIYNNGGALTLNTSIVSGNNAGAGAGVYNGSGILTLDNSSVNGNVSSGGGGGIYNGGGTVMLENSTVGDNSTSSSGGGIYNSNGPLTLDNSTVSGNTASGSLSDGGGIYNSQGRLTLDDSTVSGNTAGDDGGGVFSNTPFVSTTNPNPSQRTTIRNSTVSGNTASSMGGGVRNFYGLTIIENTTITDNTAPASLGAGVASNGASAVRTEVRASIISANDTTDVDFTDSTTNSFQSNGSNIVGDGNAVAGSTFDQLGDQTGVADPGLGPLANNGGPTQTHAVQIGSPAIDAVLVGAVAAVTAAAAEPCGVNEDQHGVARPQDGDVDGTAECDVGSYELRAAATSLTPTTHDYGNQREGTQSAPQTFTVENKGVLDLIIGAVDLQGADSTAFTEQNDQCENQTLAPGDICSVNVFFSPNSAGTKSAVLRVQSNASSSPDEAQLRGTGTAPDASLTPTTRDYGDQREGTQSAPQTFTVENTGGAVLQVGVVSIAGADSGSFNKQNDQCQNTAVASGERCTVEIVFSPGSTGNKTALLRVESDAPSSPVEAQLSGAGTATPVPPAPAPPAPNPPAPKPPVSNPKPPAATNPNACTIKGDNRNNVLRGTPRRDVICGFGGNDVIRGFGDNDVIRGGRGNDIIYGGGGNDLLYSQGGRDRLFGQWGNDALFGGRGRDVLLGGPGRNFLDGGPGKNVNRRGIDPKKAGKQAQKQARKLINTILA